MSDMYQVINIENVEGEVFNACIEGIAPNTYFYALNIYDSVINRVRVPSSTFDKVFFSSLEVKDSDMSNAVFSGSSIGGEFVGVKLIGANFTDCYIDATFRDCDMRMVSITGSKLNGAKFINCNFEDGALIENKVKNLVIDNCSLDGIELNRTFLKGVDLRSNNFNRLTIVGNELRGCLISPLQAIVVATLLGCKIG